MNGEKLAKADGKRMEIVGQLDKMFWIVSKYGKYFTDKEIEEFLESKEKVHQILAKMC
jgi:hypothetical protein